MIDVPESFAAADHRFMLQLPQIGKAPQVVYDIGASTGWWSGIVSEGMPDAAYHLFEPLWDHPLYRDQLHDNLGKHRNWTLHPVVLADNNRSAVLRVNDAATGSSILDLGENPDFIPMPKEAFRLDDYASKHQLPLPNVVKIDTQASEGLILLGGKQVISAADALLVETWFYRSYGPQTPLLGEIIDLAAEMGFIVFDYGSHYRDPEGKLHSIDLFFAKPPIAKALATLT
jgi:FkbM family methyltransferase